MIINTLRKKNLTKKILNFIYYLRYLILIFIFSSTLLFITPKLFKYVNKIEQLNIILKNQHDFSIKNSDNVKYKIFPQPNLEILNPQILIGKQIPKINIKELKIFTNFKSLYLSEGISFKKIKFKGDFLGQDINGYYIPQKNINLLYFKIKDLGIESKVSLDNKKKLSKPSGTMKLNVLNDQLLFNFDYDQNLKFIDSVYKNKNFYTHLSGQFNFKPFFYFNIFADIKKVNLKNLEIQKLYNIAMEEISNKKLNGEISINYLKKQIVGKKDLKINKINVRFDNGDIILNSSISQFSDFIIKLNFNLKRYPFYKGLNYKLFIISDDINKFYKSINLEKDKNLNEMKVLIEGKINLDAEKYYFEKIIINEQTIQEKKLLKIKNYLDKNSTKYLFTNFNEKKIYLFLKDLIESI